MIIGWKELGYDGLEHKLNENNQFNHLCRFNPVVRSFFDLGYEVVERVPCTNKCSGAYLFVHLKTDTCYVGSHNDIHQRFREHNSLLRLNKHHCKLFQKAYNDDDNLLFMFIKIDKRETAYKLEQHILNLYHGTKWLFNMAKDVYSSNKGITASEETRIKQSKSRTGLLLGIPKSHKARRNMSLGRKKLLESGYKHSAETINNQKKTRKETAIKNGYFHTPETCRKLSIAFTGRKLTPEWIENNRLAQPSKKVSIKGIIYLSISEASRKLNVHLATVYQRLNSKSDRFKDWFFVNQI